MTTGWTQERNRAVTKNHKATEPTITLTQLIRQLRKFEGQPVYSAQGLALAVLRGAAEDEQAQANAEAALAAEMAE